MAKTGAFGLGPGQARWYLNRQLESLGRWKIQASYFFVHMSAWDIEHLEPAMYGELAEGARLLRPCQIST